MKMRLIFVILFLSPVFSSIAQRNDFDSSVINGSIPVNLQSLSGFWISIDSAKNRIEIIFYANELQLKTGHGFYQMFRHDTHHPEILSGIEILWTPNDCFIKRIDECHIEITYVPFGGPPSAIQYKR